MPELKALAEFLRKQIDDSRLTMTEVASKVGYSKSQTGLYLAGKLPPEEFVTTLIDVTVREPALHRVRLARGRELFLAARSPSISVGQAGASGPGAELELLRAQQVEVYKELTASQRQVNDLLIAQRNSLQLVVVLTGMIGALSDRVESLTAEREHLLEISADPQVMERMQIRLVRALDQEARAKEELQLAREKQRQAEELAVVAQQRTAELIDELDRLRVGDTGQQHAQLAPTEAAGEPAPADLVGDDFETVLARVMAINETDDRTIRRIADELHDPDEDPPAALVQHPAGRPAVVVPVVLDNRQSDSDQAVAAGTAALIAFLSPASGPLLSGMARLGAMTGRNDSAAQAYAELVDRDTRVWGPDHTRTLKRRQQLVQQLSQSGQMGEAERVAAELVKDLARVHGPGHHSTLSVRRLHAEAVGSLGRTAEASALFADLAADYSRSPGPDHSDTLRMRELHADAVASLGKTAEAAALFADLAADYSRVWGTDNVFTLPVRYKHACLVRETGNPQEAKRLLEKLLPDARRRLKPFDSLALQIAATHDSFHPTNPDDTPNK
ncbi:hypothetical protein [Kitasatospora sp. NPDC002040]|uniref:hypothetical protein n=1 Tax=Kitasatospora sp. NPDC002040 TaxID=3154661 RepID=UPI00332ED490